MKIKQEVKKKVLNSYLRYKQLVVNIESRKAKELIQTEVEDEGAKME